MFNDLQEETRRGISHKIGLTPKTQMTLLFMKSRNKTTHDHAIKSFREGVAGETNFGRVTNRIAKLSYTMRP
jgi:hypothetical protein